MRDRAIEIDRHGRELKLRQHLELRLQREIRNCGIWSARGHVGESVRSASGPAAAPSRGRSAEVGWMWFNQPTPPALIERLSRKLRPSAKPGPPSRALGLRWMRSATRVRLC
jgi:hypothetical protein